MLEAWKDHDWEELQAAAKDLKNWMARGGFPPDIVSQPAMGPLWNRAVVRAACEFALQMAWQVLQSPEGIPEGVAFSVSCFECDTTSPASYTQAVAAGWRGIEFRPDLPMENFLGYCPDHVPKPPWEVAAEEIRKEERRCQQ